MTQRPFQGVNHMTWGLINRWNKVVMPDDECWVVGDFALGQIAVSLPLAKHLNGHKVLIPGNHDRCWPGNGAKHLPWIEKYEEAGFEIRMPDLKGDLAERTTIGPYDVQVCHFPHSGDSGSHEDRFSAWRPDEFPGVITIHGHTHRREKMSRTKKGTLQIHVGTDAWDFTPVSDATLLQLIHDNI